jgi:hypothetical protein
MLHLATALERPQRLKFLTPKNGSDITPNPCSRPCETISSRIAPLRYGQVNAEYIQNAPDLEPFDRSVAVDVLLRQEPDEEEDEEEDGGDDKEEDDDDVGDDGYSE